MSQLQNEGNDGAAAGADGAAAAAAAGAGGAQAGAAAAAGGGAFSEAAAAGDGGAAAAAEAKPLHERIPEKYRVAKDDGSIDLEASTAKLLDGHVELEKAFGSRKTAPKSPDDYQPKAEGFDFEALKQDEQYKGFLKGAHARGFTNDDVSWLLGEFASRTPSESGLMTAQDFKADMLANHWKTEQEYQENMGLGLRAIRAVVPDVTKEELAQIPNSPLVARVLAALGKEVGEDRAVRTQPLSAADFDSQLAALQASEAYNNASHPEHAQALAKAQELFNKRYPQPAS